MIARKRGASFWFVTCWPCLFIGVFFGVLVGYLVQAPVQLGAEMVRSKLSQQPVAGESGATIEAVDGAVSSPSLGANAAIQAAEGKGAMNSSNSVFLLLGIGIGVLAFWILFKLYKSNGQGTAAASLAAAVKLVEPGQPTRNRGRILLVIVGSIQGAVESLLVEAGRAGVEEIAGILLLNLDEQERDSFLVFSRRLIPSVPVYPLLVPELSAGGFHCSPQEMDNHRGKWEPKLLDILASFFTRLQQDKIHPAEIDLYDGMGSQTKLGVTAAAILHNEYRQARMYLHAIIPAQQPQRGQLWEHLGQYQQLSYIRGVITTDNGRGYESNDAGQNTLCAVRFSPSAKDIVKESAFNLLDDICPKENFGFVTLRRLQRAVTVRGSAIDKEDLLFELKQLVDELFTDDDAKALNVDYLPPVAGRAQLLGFYYPAGQQQYQDVAAELKAYVDHKPDATGTRRLTEQLADLRLRFARYEVPTGAQGATCFAVYVYAIPGQLEALTKAVGTTLPVPPAIGDSSGRSVAQTISLERATTALAASNDGLRADDGFSQLGST